MTELLVKIFVKRSEQTERTEVRTAYGMLAGITGIVCNIFLFVVKLIAGTLLRSISVTADAFNNLSDAASSVISIIGVRMAGRPADAEHPFGHGRIEYIAAFIVSFFVVQVGFTFLRTSIDKILHPEELVFQPVLLGLLVLSVLVKVWMAVFNHKLGKRTGSQIMAATAADAVGDVAATTATILSVLISHYTGWYVDGVMGLAVSLIIMWAGISIARDTLKPLIGEAADPEVYEKIKEFVECYEGITGSHDLIVHNYGPSRSMATIHAEVPNDVDVEVSHEVIDRIERDALREMNLILVIHMDPIAVNDSRTLEAKDRIEKLVAEIDSNLSIHDFRLVRGEEQTNYIFDLLVPYAYTRRQEKELRKQIYGSVRETDPDGYCVITIDKSYVNGTIK